MMVNTFFENKVDQLFEVAGRLAKALSQAGIEYRVVGGFAASPLLKRRLEKEFGSRVHKLVVPNNPGAAVVVGAAQYGLGPSLISRRRVRSDVAMTGEISLRGRVMRVGGIKEKVLAAARFGIKEVVLPDQNRADWSEVPAEVREKLKVTFLKHISELLQAVLRPK